MMPKTLSSLVCSLVLLLSIHPTFALPPLYDVMNEGDISPLLPDDMSVGYSYLRERKGVAAPAEKGATVTQYEVQEIFSGLAIPVSSGALDITTLLPGPVTRTYVMNQGASTLHISAAPSIITTAGLPIRIRGSVKDCNLDQEKQEGVCVEEVQQPMVTVFTDLATTTTSTFISTYTATYTRPLEKLFISGGSSIFASASVRSSTLVGGGLLIGAMML